MSLLMQALKKAEEEKKLAAKEDSNSDLPVLSMTPLADSDDAASSVTTSTEAMAGTRAFTSPELEHIEHMDPHSGHDLTETMALSPRAADLTDLTDLTELANADFALSPENKIPSTPDFPLDDNRKMQESAARLDDLAKQTMEENNRYPGNTDQAQQKATSLFAAKQNVSSGRPLAMTALWLTIGLIVAFAGYHFWKNYGQIITEYQRIVPATDAASDTPEIKTDSAASLPTTGIETASGVANTSSGLSPIRDITRANANSDLNEISDLGNGGNSTLSDQPLNSRQKEHRAQIALADKIEIHKRTNFPTLNSDLANAYQLFSTGDYNTARSFYETVLRKEPKNRDALLGMAAIALNQNRPNEAAALYSHMLDLNPSDPDAIAGLNSLQHGDPVQRESQLKNVLAQHPESGPVLFELGNLYSQQSRWSEAQEVYFRAFGVSPKSADYAFNLAVSLDQLGQVNLALEYYQRALALAITSPGKFSREAAKKRVEQLETSINLTSNP